MIYRSTSEVVLDTRNILILWFGLLLHQMGANFLRYSMIKAWMSTVKFIWLCCREKINLHTRRCSSSHSDCDPEVAQERFPRLLGQANVATLSPLVNSIDITIWSILERDVSTRSNPNLDPLKTIIQSAWTNMDEEVVWRFCASVKACLRLMINAKDGCFEK